uniref:Putative plasminogen activator inhibitor 1 rna-binding protein-like isoform x4 n=1 Tax=Xenopsylla cheopis TaxID=163159 RepID=A0A6M2DHR3_XENCH
MENMYGVGVTNRYNLFLEEEVDPIELLQDREKEKELRKRSKFAEKENKGKPETKSKTVTAPRKGIKESANIKSQEIKAREDKAKPLVKLPAERNERVTKVAGANREERNNRRNREDRPYNPPGDREDRPPHREFNDADRNRTVGTRGPRTARGGRFNDSRGKREFDRQSGSDKSGIKPVDKREGAGAHNWGSHKDDIADLNKSGQSENDPFLEGDKADSNVTTENTTNTKANSNGQDNETAEKPEAPVEEEPKELTLDEWKAQRAALRQKPNYNLRKAGEGEDLTQWKKMYALDKKKEGVEEGETDDELEYDAAEYPQRVGRQKHVLDIEFTFNDVRRGRGGGGGRGRGRTRGNMGRGDRPARPPFKTDDVLEVTGGTQVERDSNNPRGKQNAPKVDDEHDFPSLG